MSTEKKVSSFLLLAHLFREFGGIFITLVAVFAEVLSPRSYFAARGDLRAAAAEEAGRGPKSRRASTGREGQRRGFIRASRASMVLGRARGDVGKGPGPGGDGRPNGGVAATAAAGETGASRRQEQRGGPCARGGTAGQPDSLWRELHTHYRGLGARPPLPCLPAAGAAAWTLLRRVLASSAPLPLHSPARPCRRGCCHLLPRGP